MSNYLKYLDYSSGDVTYMVKSAIKHDNMEILNIICKNQPDILDLKYFPFIKSPNMKSFIYENSSLIKKNIEKYF